MAAAQQIVVFLDRRPCVAQVQTPRAGVTVTSELAGDKLRVQINLSGPAMPAETLEKKIRRTMPWKRIRKTD
jgi:hypothetical protein